jgi:large subunit ribosomal protein L4
VAEENLASEIFDTKTSPSLTAQAIRVQLANQRHAIANTKTRGEVSGGGRKPFKQKGTGNARAGSTRSPLWTGGGVTFGPKNNRNFSLRLPQKMRQSAIKAALSDKAKEKRLIILKDLQLPEISTKKLVGILEKLPIEEGKILAVLPEMNANFELSSANLPYLKTIKVNNLNILDLLNYDYILMTTESLKKIGEIFQK